MSINIKYSIHAATSLIQKSVTTMNVNALCKATNAYEPQVQEISWELIKEHGISVCADKGGVKVKANPQEYEFQPPYEILTTAFVNGHFIGNCKLTDTKTGTLNIERCCSISK